MKSSKTKIRMIMSLGEIFASGIYKDYIQVYRKAPRFQRVATMSSFKKK